MKLLALLCGLSLISFEIRLSSLQFPVWDAKSVVVESSGGEAIADRSVKVIKEFVVVTLSPIFNLNPNILYYPFSGKYLVLSSLLKKSLSNQHCLNACKILLVFLKKGETDLKINGRVVEFEFFLGHRLSSWFFTI